MRNNSGKIAGSLFKEKWVQALMGGGEKKVGLSTTVSYYHKADTTFFGLKGGGESVIIKIRKVAGGKL